MGNQLKWDKRFLDAAELIASWSKDRSTKIGAVVVGDKREIRAIGYNGFPRGVNDDVENRHERPAKYLYAEHAERNAIYNACYAGTSLDGCTMYVTHMPCADCARAIIQSGIKRVVISSKNKLRSNWEDSTKVALEMMDETNVKFEEVDN